jgi:hypothetical protein
MSVHRVDRKRPTDGQSDAIDPTRTWGAAMSPRSCFNSWALIFGLGEYPSCFNTELCAAKPAIPGGRRE